jgi:hypothetical protein
MLFPSVATSAIIAALVKWHVGVCARMRQGSSMKGRCRRAAFHVVSHDEIGSIFMGMGADELGVWPSIGGMFGIRVKTGHKDFSLTSNNHIMGEHITNRITISHNEEG